MAQAARPSRPLRRAFGLVTTLVAAADIAVATAVEHNEFGIPTVPAVSQGPMLGYGLVLLAIGLWSVGTSFGSRRSTVAPAIAARSARIARGADEASVIHALRDVGWYVADDVALAHVHLDHVAVGPAGVLVVQTQRTDRADPRGKTAIRARLAASQLRQELAARELDVEVVPAVLMFGPGLTDEPGGVKVADAVAMLNGYQAAEWLDQLSRRSLIDPALVDAVRAVVGDLREGAQPSRRFVAHHGVRAPALVR